MDCDYIQMELSDLEPSNPPPPCDHLFKRRTPAGSYRRREAICEAVKIALANCPLSREEVAAELSRLTGDEICIHTLNNWVAVSKQSRRLPLEYAEALVAITGDQRIIEAAFQAYTVLDRKKTAFYELGKLVAEEKQRSKRKRQIFEKVGL